MQDSTQRKPSRHPKTAWRIFSGEAVIITSSENKVRMLNPVGSRIWELADGTRTIDDIVEVLGAEYEVHPGQARQAALDFLAILTDKALLNWVDT